MKLRSLIERAIVESDTADKDSLHVSFFVVRIQDACYNECDLWF